MGGCATKPRDLESDVPKPVEEEQQQQKEAIDAEQKEAVENKEEAADQANGTRSLGVLFDENEETKEPTETEKMAAVEAEAVAAPALEENQVLDTAEEEESVDKISEPELSPVTEAKTEPEAPVVKEVVHDENVTEKKEEA